MGIHLCWKTPSRLANSHAQEKRAGGTPLGSWETNHLFGAVMRPHDCPGLLGRFHNASREGSLCPSGQHKGARVLA